MGEGDQDAAEGRADEADCETARIVGRALFSQTPNCLSGISPGAGGVVVDQPTTFGLALQAVGEAPAAGLSMGIKVRRLRWFALIACGALAGIGGSQLTLAGLGTFHAKRHGRPRLHLALAAVIFGSWQPFGTLLAVQKITRSPAGRNRA